MRISSLTLALALAAATPAFAQSIGARPAAAPYAVDTPPGAPSQPTSVLPAQPKPEDPVLAFYPAGARAAGVEGKVVLACARTPHLRLDGCTLVSESPPGEGFGQAALDMAAQSKDNPKIVDNDPKLTATADLTISFSLHPPDIAPDVTQVAHMRIPPQVMTRPTDAQIQAAYPSRALEQQVDGEAIIDCAVDLEGALSRCQLYAEGPIGYGFGEAALDVAGDFRAKPGLIDGEAVSGALIRLGVEFAPQNPDAPLTLQAPGAKRDSDDAGDNQPASGYGAGGGFPGGGPSGGTPGGGMGQGGPPGGGYTPH